MQPASWLPRPPDLVWLALYAALALLGPEASAAEWEILAAMAVFQVTEPRIPWFSTPGGVRTAIGIKLILGFLLIGVTGGISSSYYLVLVVPIVAAATSFGAWGTLSVALLACATYLSFLLFVPWDRYEISESQYRELSLRVLLLSMVAPLTYQLAAANREQTRRAREAAAGLEAANQSLRDAEAAVRRSERLAAMGQLTAGLAHELRNPLGTIKASAELLSRQVPSDNAVARELAGYVVTEVDRTNSLVTRFLDFARPLSVQPSPADLHEIADRAIARLERLPGRPDVHIVRNYSADVPPVPCDEDLIERALYNLILNAAEASPAGSTVTLRTRREPTAVEIAVIDRGSGIDPAQLENVFNPFFTTKPSGTGLGLAIVSKIVDEHGGKITVTSEPGEGAVFRILLPL